MYSHVCVRARCSFKDQPQLTFMNLNALIEPSALPSGHTLALSRNLPTLLEPRDLSALLRNIRASGAKCVHPTPTPSHPIPSHPVLHGWGLLPVAGLTLPHLPRD